MRKALVHIIFLGLLLLSGLSHAAVLPHNAMTTSDTAKDNPESKHTANGYERNSQISKDLVISDWDEFDESDYDDHAGSANKAGCLAVASNMQSLLNVGVIRKTFSDKIYTDFNFSRLPRYNYISLRVLRL